ncbi:hypothetical protein LQZ19_06565 [Treponema primitia]|uniref:hypothetical protein n=1 Tax=Treponema primitia TaxID=88058 RepID=UPI00397EE0B0
MMLCQAPVLGGGSGRKRKGKRRPAPNLPLAAPNRLRRRQPSVGGRQIERRFRQIERPEAPPESLGIRRFSYFSALASGPFLRYSRDMIGEDTIKVFHAMALRPGVLERLRD